MAKKVAKKSSKKAVNKQPKKAGKKTAKKTIVKKQGAKKATKKKTVKTSAKKVGSRKTAKKQSPKSGKAYAKKTVKKVNAKKNASKRKAPKKVASRKASPKKSITKKAVKKQNAKNVIKKTAKKPFAKRLVKRSVEIKSFQTQISETVKDALDKVVEKVKSILPGKSTEPYSDGVEKNKLENTPLPELKPEEVPVKKTFTAHSTSLKEGMEAPYFEGLDQNGDLVKSIDFRGKTLVLYFYPKDNTPGCTAESCSLRDEYEHLKNRNYAVIGVSADDEASHKRFADKFQLPFQLIADTDKTIIKSYDVWGEKQLAGNIYDGIIRTTFVINPEGIIQSVIKKVDTENHAKQILDLV
jgi:thioredoxin-dependent peroxiredoxin